MTAWVVDAVLFGWGVYLCLRLIAASYRVLDLWYTIRTAWPAVLGGIAVWGGAAAATATLLGGRHRTAVVLGLAAYLLFYLSLYGLRHLALGRTAPLE